MSTFLKAGLLLSAGVLGSSLLAFGLGCAGWLNPFLLLALLALVGLWISRWIRLPWRWIAGWVLLVAIILVWPGRGFWVAGGWDPGVYVNQGAALARAGSFTLPQERFYEQLGPGVVEALTAEQRCYREWFPGFPLDPERGGPTLQFPRFTSALYSLAPLFGPPWSGARMPGVLALLAVVTWFCWARWQGAASWSWLFALTLLLHPVFLYHTHTPSSEMVELWLVGLLGLLMLAPLAQPVRAGALALLLLAAAANRTSFILWGGLFLILQALLDLDRPDRRRVVVERLLMILGLFVGAGLHHLFTPVAVAKLAHILPRLEGMGGLACITALCLDLIAAWPTVRAQLLKGRRFLLAAGLVGGVLAVTGFAVKAGAGSPACAMLHYLGWPWLLLAGSGLLVMAGWERDTRRLALPLWCLAVTILTLSYPHVAELYPWATKRLLPFTVPLLAMGAFAWLALLPPRGRVVGALLILTALALQLPLSRQAWRVTSFDGVGPALRALAVQAKDADGVVSDHFRWATPLALTWGVPTVNGEALWRAPAADSTRMTWGRLASLARSGLRIRLFTSTSSGVGLWGPEVPPVRLLWSSGPVSYRETRHHRSMRGFESVDKTLEFRLYELIPEPSHGG